MRIIATTDIPKLPKDQPLESRKPNPSIAISTYALPNKSNPIQELNMPESGDMEDVVGRKEVHVNTFSPSRQQQNALQETIFTIQIGAFLLKQNAEARQAYLENKGYPARLITLTDSQQRVWYTVRVGTYDNREEASRFAKEISSKESLVASVRPKDDI